MSNVSNLQNELSKHISNKKIYNPPQLIQFFELPINAKGVAGRCFDGGRYASS